MNSLDARLTALSDALQRRQMLQQGPLDGLSASLFSLQAEFAALDEKGKLELLEELNTPGDDESGVLHLSLEDVTKFISDFTK